MTRNTVTLPIGNPPPPYTPSPNNFKVSLEEYSNAGIADGRSLLVKITPPAEGPSQDEKKAKRAPIDLCAVIDISGSMNADATPPAEDGKPAERTGLDILDVVKHAMKTILATMENDDRLAVVAFTSNARVISKFTFTTTEGKQKLLKGIEGMQPENSTNLWDGLKMGMGLFDDLNKGDSPTSTTSRGLSTITNLIQKQPNTPAERVSSLFILTDGMPNVNPPRGHIPMLKQYLDSHPDLPCSISTFGFGYSLDSQLMSDIARVGGGGYGFIPDAGMVGTVFVHAVSNLYATYAQNSKMTIELPEGVKIKRVMGDFVYNTTSWGAEVDIGDLQYGQTRDVVVELQGKPILPKKSEMNINVTARPWNGTSTTVTTNSQLEPVTNVATNEFLFHYQRLKFIYKVYDLFSHMPQAYSTDQKPYLEKACEDFRHQGRILQKIDHPAAQALSQDLLGEVCLALTKLNDWNRWGAHYFPSLARSHQRQQCGNFKDPGLQIWGQESAIFKKSRDQVDAAFDALPPPKPSKKVTASTKVVRSMARYNMAMGGCFAGHCLITLADDTQIRLDTLKRNMLIKTSKGFGRVGAVLKTNITQPVSMCRINDSVLVTPWHPVVHNGAWTFPASICEPELVDIPAYYTVLLQANKDVDANTMEIEGITAVTLGHGVTDGDVRAHSFFSSHEKVVRSMMDLEGFFDDSGVAACGGMKRDEKGLIRGFVRIDEVELIDNRHILEEGIVA